MYKDNPDVVFVDISLRDAEQGQFRGPPHNPGAGGWPTIRYYNSDTGTDGGSYQKVTEKSMCEELGGDRMLLMDYIEGYGNTILCDTNSGTNCNEKELGYIEKYKSSDLETLQSQLDRLYQMKGLNTDLQLWVYRRIRILKQLQAGVAAASATGEGTEL